MIFTCDSYFQSLNTPLGNRPLCFRTTVAGRGVLLQKTATMKIYTKDIPEYRTWTHLKHRCCNRGCDRYKNYGGRGIKVCDRWKSSFNNFLLDMGKKPSLHHSIERIDNDGNYEPGNCRWATRKEQQNNQRSNHKITANGKTLNMAQWAEILGVKHSVLWERKIRGWSDERTINQPVRPRRLTHVKQKETK